MTPEFDLFPILSRLRTSRQSEDVQRRRANHPLTRGFLEAGRELISEQYANAQAEHREGAGATKSSPLISEPSKKQVVDQVNARTALGATLAKFDDRWKYKSDYTVDLIAYCLSHRQASAHFNSGEERSDALLHGDFVEAIQEAAYLDQLTIRDDSSLLLSSTLAAIISSRDPGARASIAEVYSVINETWSVRYEQMLKSRGLRLRPDVTTAEIALLLSSLSDGLGLRLVSEPSPMLIDDEHRQSFLGRFTAYVLAGVLDPGDGEPVESYLERFLDRPPS